jgi:hypothetical protein
MILRALRSLAGDSWVLGIAAAAALAYAVVRLAEALIDFVLQLGDGVPVIVEEPLPEGFYDPPYTFVAFGRYVYYGDLLSSAVLFFVIVAAVAAVVHVTGPRDEADATPASEGG